MRARAGGGSWAVAVQSATVGLAIAAGGAAVACDSRPQECPRCECKRDCPAPVVAPVASPVSQASGAQAGASQVAAGSVVGPAHGTVQLATGPLGGPAGGQVVQPGPDVGELVSTATRKLMHDDGVGCLEDLDKVAAIDPKLDLRLAATRGQCEMLVGRCQPGKERVARWYEVEAGMQPERAMITAEQIGSMRCREGDSSDRDRLLRAYFDLSDGAYMNRRSSEFCGAALATARELIPKVKPRGPDDAQIASGAQALFHTAASCFARAGDCKQAWTTYSGLFPRTATTPEAEAMMPEIIRGAYDSSVLFCGAEQRDAPIPQSPPQRR